MDLVSISEGLYVPATRFGFRSQYPIGREGKIWKRGHFVKNWKQRHFVLKNNVLKYFIDESKTSLKGSFVISESCTVEMLNEGWEGHHNNLAIRNGTAELFLSADNTSEQISWYAAIRDAIMNSLPEVLEPELGWPKFRTKCIVDVQYEGDVQVADGNVLKCSQLRQPPDAHLSFREVPALSEYFTLMAYDVDHPSRKDARRSHYLLWMVANIHLEDVQQAQEEAAAVGCVLRASSGLTAVPYQPPSPAQLTGLHRIFYVVFKQSHVLSKHEACFEHFAGQRSGFDARAAAAALDLLAPQGIDGCYTEWDLSAAQPVLLQLDSPDRIDSPSDTDLDDERGTWSPTPQLRHADHASMPFKPKPLLQSALHNSYSPPHISPELPLVNNSSFPDMLDEHLLPGYASLEGNFDLSSSRSSSITLPRSSDASRASYRVSFGDDVPPPPMTLSERTSSPGRPSDAAAQSKLVSALKGHRPSKTGMRRKSVSFKEEAVEARLIDDALPDEVACDMMDYDFDQPDYQLDYSASAAKRATQVIRPIIRSVAHGSSPSSPSSPADTSSAEPSKESKERHSHGHNSKHKHNSNALHRPSAAGVDSPASAADLALSTTAIGSAAIALFPSADEETKGTDPSQTAAVVEQEVVEEVQSPWARHLAEISTLLAMGAPALLHGGTVPLSSVCIRSNRFISRRCAAEALQRGLHFQRELRLDEPAVAVAALGEGGRGQR